MENKTNQPTAILKPIQGFLFELGKVSIDETKAEKTIQEAPVKTKEEPYNFFMPFDCR